MNLGKLVKRFRIDRPETFKLSSFDPSDTGGFEIGKEEAKKIARRSRQASRQSAGAALRAKTNGRC